MIKPAISPLRQRMIEDMEIRGFAPRTQRGYLRVVRDFAAFFGRPPDAAGAEDLRRYQHHLRAGGTSATSINAASPLSECRASCAPRRLPVAPHRSAHDTGRLEFRQMSPVGQRTKPLSR